MSALAGKGEGARSYCGWTTPSGSSYLSAACRKRETNPKMRRGTRAGFSNDAAAMRVVAK
jgi:hypothetical protein